MAHRRYVVEPTLLTPSVTNASGNDKKLFGLQSMQSFMATAFGADKEFRAEEVKVDIQATGSKAFAIQPFVVEAEGNPAAATSEGVFSCEDLIYDYFGSTNFKLNRLGDLLISRPLASSLFSVKGEFSLNKAELRSLLKFRRAFRTVNTNARFYIGFILCAVDDGNTYSTYVTFIENGQYDQWSKDFPAS